MSEVEQKKKIINDILELSFSYYINFKHSEVEEGISPTDIGILFDFNDERRAWLEEQAILLDEFNTEDIRNYYSFERGITKTKRANHWQISNTLSEMQPPSLLVWWAAGFHIKNLSADFEEWAKMSSLKLHEAVALSVGFEPCGLVIDYNKEYNVAPRVLNFITKRQRIIESKFYPFGELTISQPSPEELCEWALEIQLDIPEEFVRAVNKIKKTNFKVKGSSTKAKASKGLQNRERASMLKMIIAMAVDGYGYKIDSERSPVPKDIADALDQMGISLDLDTIRKYLKEARDILPKDYKQE